MADINGLFQNPDKVREHLAVKKPQELQLAFDAAGNIRKLFATIRESLARLIRRWLMPRRTLSQSPSTGKSASQGSESRIATSEF
jgi:hypothetical protein